MFGYLLDESNCQYNPKFRWNLISQILAVHCALIQSVSNFINNTLNIDTSMAKKYENKNENYKDRNKLKF